MATSPGEGGLKILLTGGAGFIGSRCLRHFLRRGDDVVVVDAFEDTLYPRAIKDATVAESRRAGDFVLHAVDVRDRAALTRVAGAHGPFDALVHLAGVAGVRASVSRASYYHDVNVTGTQVVLEVARAHGAADKLILASSSSVYGNAQTPFAESATLATPVSPYAASKLAMERLARSDHQRNGGNMTCLRFFTVYGPGQRPDMAVHTFMRLMAAGEPIPMFGDGTSGRDTTYVDDIVAGVAAATDRAGGFNVYNLGGDRVVQLAELIHAISAVVGKPVSIHRLPMQPGDVQVTEADISRARADLDYAPKTSLHEGLARMWDWYQARQAQRC